LSPDERVEEVARMLAGEQVTEGALTNARDMLAGKIPAKSLFG
jgi:DNA repair protein RecN (Recombination protein N)